VTHLDSFKLESLEGLLKLVKACEIMTEFLNIGSHRYLQNITRSDIALTRSVLMEQIKDQN